MYQAYIVLFRVLNALNKFSIIFAFMHTKSLPKRDRLYKDVVLEQTPL